MDEPSTIFSRNAFSPDALLEQATEKLLAKGMSLEAVANQIAERLPEVVAELGRLYFADMIAHASDTVRDQSVPISRFLRRLRKDWSEPLSQLRLLLAAATDIGNQFCAEFAEPAERAGDFVFNALMRLHVRSCRTANEVLWLLEGGFASAAHSRWRTLHELNVVSWFIREKGQETAERYLLHHVAESWKGMLGYQQHCHKLGDTAFSPAEMDEARAEVDALCQRFGRVYREPWGWAAAALRLDRPSFADVEKAVGFEHFRPHYKMSSHPTHAGSKGIWFDLGNELNEDGDDLGSAGPSNAGLAEPGIATTHSLFQVTVNFIQHGEPQLEKSAFSVALQRLAEQTEQAFAEADARLERIAPIVRARLERFLERHSSPEHSL
jgi:hypothetical protein